MAISSFLWSRLLVAKRRRLNHRLCFARRGAVEVLIPFLEFVTTSPQASQPAQRNQEENENQNQGGNNWMENGEDEEDRDFDDRGVRVRRRGSMETENEGIPQAAAAALAHIAATSDASEYCIFSLEVIDRLMAWMGRESADILARESVCMALQEVLGGRDPSLVLVSIVKSLGSDSPKVRLSTLQSLAAIQPKQCSCRERQTISKTGLIGALVNVLWQPAEGDEPQAETEGGDNPMNQGGRAGVGAQDRGEGDGQNNAQDEQAARLAQEQVRRKCEILASNLIVRLATQMEWESDKTPLFDEVTGRLCNAIVDDPTGPRGEKAAILLAVLANTLGNTLAYMRLYEASAETMPLRLEQVRLDLRRLSSELVMMQRNSPNLLQAKSLHFLSLAIGPLSSLLVSEATVVAKAAAALNIALLASQRPNIDLPPALLENIVALLANRHWTASYAAEALGALCIVPSLEKQFDEQGVVEQLVQMARNGDVDAKVSTATVLSSLARRRRRFREQSKACGAVEVLEDMENNGQASVREAASTALTALSQSMAEDLLAACSSTGYFCLVLFCFSVQLGGVNAVMDVIEVCSDILYVLSRITSLRLRMHDPSAIAIFTDFLLHDPIDLFLILFMIAIIPSIAMYFYLRNRNHLTDVVEIPDRQAWSRRHRSWLLGITLRQSESSIESEEGVAEDQNSSGARYVVSEVMPDGPARNRIKLGDELISVDDHVVEGLDINSLIKVLRGKPRMSVAERSIDLLQRVTGLSSHNRSGKGSEACLVIRRIKKTGRKETKKIWLRRGNWYGSYDDVPEPAQGQGNGVAEEPCSHQRLALAANKPADAGHEAGDLALRSAADEADDMDERVCRICQCTEEEAPEQGKLFSPCLCRGTMRFIHVKCLDTWRRMSANATSNFQCDQCSFLYRVQRRGVARIVQKTGVVEVVSLLLFGLGIFLTGFLVKWARLSLESPVPFDPPLPELESLSGVLAVDWHHVMSGCIGVGIIGFSTLVILLPMRGFGFIGYHPNLFRGSSKGDSSATVVLCIVVVAGMIRALFLCYKFISYLAGIVAERSGTVILPADAPMTSSVAPQPLSRLRGQRWGLRG